MTLPSPDQSAPSDSASYRLLEWSRTCPNRKTEVEALETEYSARVDRSSTSFHRLLKTHSNRLPRVIGVHRLRVLALSDRARTTPVLPVQLPHVDRTSRFVVIAASIQRTLSRTRPHIWGPDTGVVVVKAQNPDLGAALVLVVLGCSGRRWTSLHDERCGRDPRKPPTQRTRQKLLLSSSISAPYPREHIHRNRIARPTSD